MAQVIRPHEIEAGGQAAEAADLEQRAEGTSDAPEGEAKHVHYRAKEGANGAAKSPERDAMYQDLEGVGEAGNMGDLTGREDHNPIGPLKADSPAKGPARG